MRIGHRKEIRKLTFRALALRFAGLKRPIKITDHSPTRRSLPPVFPRRVGTATRRLTPQLMSSTA